MLTSHNKFSTKYLHFKASIPPQAVGQIGCLFINLFFTLHLFSFHLILEVRVIYWLQYSFSIPLLLILEVRVLYKLQYFCRQNFAPTFIFNCHSLIWLTPSHTHTHNTTKWVDLIGLYHQLILEHTWRISPALPIFTPMLLILIMEFPNSTLKFKPSNKCWTMAFVESSFHNIWSDSRIPCPIHRFLK